MPRATRYLVEGHTYHLTHRCHDRRFLLRFKHERDLYREWLRIAVDRYRVSVFGYCVTSNHVHVVAHADSREAIGQLMQLPSGVVAKQLNQRKGHEGSVWEHPYQCTMIQDGRHLLHCLRYVDLNMFRTGTVLHPQAWRWCGYDELTGQRRRYRILDIDRLLQHAAISSVAELARLHAESIQERIQQLQREREPYWTEAVAVGDLDFIRKAGAEYSHRQSFSESEVPEATELDTWMIREVRQPYSADFSQESET
jgi:putative transposase